MNKTQLIEVVGYIILVVLIVLTIFTRNDSDYGNFFMTLATVTITLLSISIAFIVYICQQHSEHGHEIKKYIECEIRNPLNELRSKVKAGDTKARLWKGGREN